LHTAPHYHNILNADILPLGRGLVGTDVFGIVLEATAAGTTGFGFVALPHMRFLHDETPAPQRAPVGVMGLWQARALKSCAEPESSWRNAGRGSRAQELDYFTLALWNERHAASGFGCKWRVHALWSGLCTHTAA